MFELNYTSWLILPRVVIEAMPHKWQEKMKKLLNELNGTFNWRPKNIKLYVQARNKNGEFIRLPPKLCNYRRPNKRWLKSIKIKEIKDQMPKAPGIKHRKKVTTNWIFNEWIPNIMKEFELKFNCPYCLEITYYSQFGSDNLNEIYDGCTVSQFIICKVCRNKFMLEVPPV